MQHWEKYAWILTSMGAIIGLGKLLVSTEELTVRLIIGRTILGAGSSLVAGVLILQIPDVDPLALVGVGSTLGILGSSVIEAYLKSKIKFK